MSIPLRRKGLRRKGGSDASGGAFPGFGGAPAAIDIGDAGSGGAAATASRSDHQHELLAPAGAPPPIAAAGAVGISTRPGRSDHTHEGVHSVNGMLGDVVIGGAFPGFGPAPVQIDAGDGAVVGVSGLAAQSDHQHAVNTAGLAEIADSDAGAESAGVSLTIPRGDHKHSVATAAPTAALDIGDAAVAGVAATLARSDHQHSFPAPAGAPPAIAAAGAAGAATTPARSDHTHEGVHSVNGAGGDVLVTAFPGFGGVPPQIDAGDAGTAGVAATASRSDHEHPVSTALVGAIAAADAGAASAGVATSIPRGDHKHSVSTAAPTAALDIGDAAAAGVADTLARSDHQHAFPAPGAGYPVDVDAGAEADGIATTPARSDHKHHVAVAAPTAALDIGDAAVEGVAAGLARADHQHSFPAPAGTPADVASAAAAGAATTPARSDHAHRGLRSIEANAAGDLFGDIRLIDSATVLFTQAGNDISAAVVSAAVNRTTISVSQVNERLQLGAGEIVIAEANVNPAVFQVGTSVTPFLSAIAQRTAGTATVRVRVGGTINTADGTIRASFAATSAAFAQYKNVGASFDMNASDVGVGALVKITLEAAAGETIRAYGIEATFSG